MSFDREDLARAIDRYGIVARVVVAAVKGSAPREAGAAMLVWPGGQSGTIGGGALEFEAASEARARLTPGTAWVTRQALGPHLNQCCGGAVVLVTEVYDVETLARIEPGPVIRRIEGAGEMPMAIHGDLRRLRGEGVALPTRFENGWLSEPERQGQRPLWVFGAGHVGRALVATLAPLPGFAITWVDTAPERFPEAVPDGVAVLPVSDPQKAVRLIPEDAQVLILTYSHVLDLDLCHAALSRGLHRIGLIGSATKWARFRSRLRHLGHAMIDIDKITCPIGDPALGKHPQAIAISVAAALLRANAAAGVKQRGREA